MAGPGLQDNRAGVLCLFQQQRVQGFAAERAAPGLRVLGSGQGGRHCAVGVQKAHPVQFGAGLRTQGPTDAECVQQRQVARGDAFTADLATREALLLDHGDRPAGARQQNRSGRAGRSGADDDRVEA